MNIISLYSGAGGLDLGLIQAGNAVVWANDIDHDSVETYKRNIGDQIVEGDIRYVLLIHKFEWKPFHKSQSFGISRSSEDFGCR